MAENGTNTGGVNQQVGQVFVIFGAAKAISSDGSERVLGPNSPIFADDRIVTGGDGRVSISFDGPGKPQLDLGRNSDVAIDQDLFGDDVPPDLLDITSEVKDIQEALQKGLDPSVELEAPAAGPPAGVFSGGPGFPKFGLTAAEVTPDAFAETVGVESSFLDPNIE